MLKWLCACAALMVAACGSPPPSDDLGRIATDYVRMQLEIGEREPGYVDAYYGPADWQAAAKASPRSLDALAAEAASLTERTQSIAANGVEPMEQRRRLFMLGQLKAAETRLRMLRGEKLSFADEAEGLFGVRPELQELASYDPVLARIERLVPGPGTLADRIDAFQKRFDIPTDRLKPVFDAAIAECRTRTLRHIALPQNERFTMAFVTGKSWGAYNYYKGNATSLIEVNTTLPVRIDRAVDYGCHEGYPGHHVYNLLLERNLAEARGWTEFTVYPLYSPQSFIAEGSANYGIDLAFPGRSRLDYEAGTLYPLAGLPADAADDYFALMAAMRDLAGARFTIARDYLDGRIDRAEAIALAQKYQLLSRDRAEQSLDFTDQYRSYVINYGLGQDRVRAFVERAGANPEARWEAFEQLISGPTIPADLD